MLGLRLDEPLPLTGVELVLDRSAIERMVRGGLAVAGLGPAAGRRSRSRGAAGSSAEE